MTINETVDTEEQRLKDRLVMTNRMISEQMLLIEVASQYPAVFEKLRQNRPVLVEDYHMSLKEAEKIGEKSEKLPEFEKLEKSFFIYSQAYVRIKQNYSGQTEGRIIRLQL